MKHKVFPVAGPLSERVMCRVEKAEDGCWNWVGSVGTHGYGRLTLPNNGDWRQGGHQIMAHRVSYEAFVGPIPEGLTLDHLCRNKRCVNPEHLEPVTMRENILRSDNVSARNARKTHCPRGHLLEAHPAGKGRWCAICQKEAQRTWVPKNVNLDAVRELRLQGLTQKQIGLRLGVSHMAVGAALRVIYGPKPPTLQDLRGGGCKRGHPPTELYIRNGRISYCRACKRDKRASVSAHVGRSWADCATRGNTVG